MLTLTDNATTIVKDIVTQPGVPEGIALRITAEQSGVAAFSVSAARPRPGDLLVEQQGASIYLDEASASLLDDKILDAAVDETGRVEFALEYQG